MKIERVNPDDVFDPPTYTQALRVTGATTIIFLSGQIAYDDDGGVLHEGDFAGQTREVYRSIRSLVEEAGGTMESIVKLTTYLTDMGNYPELVKVRSEFFPKKGPAGTAVEVGALLRPEWMVEIEAIAVI